MNRRHELTDTQWEHLKPLLPPQKQAFGRPYDDHRRIINGILWKLKTGAPWRDLPERYGPWSTVYSRFFRWKRKGIWDQLYAVIQTEADKQGAVNWEVHYVDGTIIRAHQHAAGLKKRILKRRGIGLQSRRLYHKGASENRR
jgi:transposase